MKATVAKGIDDADVRLHIVDDDGKEATVDLGPSQCQALAHLLLVQDLHETCCGIYGSIDVSAVGYDDAVDESQVIDPAQPHGRIPPS